MWMIHHADGIYGIYTGLAGAGADMIWWKREWRNQTVPAKTKTTSTCSTNSPKWHNGSNRGRCWWKGMPQKVSTDHKHSYSSFDYVIYVCIMLHAFCNCSNGCEIFLGSNVLVTKYLSFNGQKWFETIFASIGCTKYNKISANRMSRQKTTQKARSLMVENVIRQLSDDWDSGWIRFVLASIIEIVDP